LEKGEKLNAYLLITHPHWDHIQGFPFFKPAFLPGHEITIVGAESDKVTLERMITDQMNKVYFPILLSELNAKVTFKSVAEEEFDLFDARVQTIFVNHPSFALGYRITQNGKSLIYISDNEPYDRGDSRTYENVDQSAVELYRRTNGDPNQRVVDFVREADILIHDATYTSEEYSKHVGWGHSPWNFALRIAEEGRVKKLVLFHHDPAHTDEQVDQIVEWCRNDIRQKDLHLECVAAAEGMILEL
jgi:phosphoribosyl 1,2-cyclic phosphodiesterase